MEHLLAAVDLGSNSFRLSIGRVAEQNGAKHIYQIDRMKETVRLAAGLDAAKMLNEESISRCVEVLKLFGDRLRSFHPDRVRAVATNTFRVARNVADFLPRAEEALGFPIEVIAGREEARLIYAGVSHTLPINAEKRLVIDIGGGSTEVIIGKGDDPILLSSLYMGCVSYSRQFFPNGVIDAQSMKMAEVAARREIEVITKPYRKQGWDTAIGSSGTAKALYAILTEGGLSKDGITREGLERLKTKLIRAGKVVPHDLPGIKLERADVLTGGLAIMSAFFDEMGVDVMKPGDGALRLGVLVDLAGREEEHDRRDESVKAFMKRYHVDPRQALRVKKCALSLYDSIYPDKKALDEMRHALSWAADLHEVGMSIALNGYHKHSAYILNNADMPGFSRVDQSQLGLLTLVHTGKLGKAQALVKTRDQWLLILCLRLAVLLCRRRVDIAKLPLTVAVKGNSIVTRVDKKWLATHPLTDFSLHNEESEWSKVGFDFELIPV
ncbi:exopolyphosphatase [Orrella sp. NBD-18]|uniref:Exopolyphosphatase n=1 Tax=Sheuella amnicola TaxID=2707330 RepID=A0A6B2R139_9BURK|nr:exopolyphosphatase [Sheuella amnicola]NDY83843.1 exopolyphosphatase [Sheuella amnicola]HBI82835.1 exopolyphosphatase [Alcaligenaceae bacterium]